MIYNLLVSLLLLTYCSYRLNNKEFLSPAFLFSISFLFACIWFIPWNEQWSGIHLNTFFVIVGGVAVFILFSFIMKRLFNLLSSAKNFKCNDCIEIKVSFGMKFVFLCFMCITIVWSAYYMIKVMGGSIADISKSVLDYRVKNMFSDDFIEKKSSVLKMFETLCLAGNFWFEYALVNNYIANKKIDKFILMIVILNMISNMVLTAGRGGISAYLFAILFYYVLLSNKKQLNFTLLIKAITFCVFFLFIFVFVLDFIARQSNENKIYYLAIYISAPIKNLDMFIQNTHGVPAGGDNQTFFVFLHWLSDKLGLHINTKVMDLPFNSINNLSLGNVYTTFYQFIYDYGYMGVVFMTGIVAMISQFSYQCVQKVKLKSMPSLSILIYCYIADKLLFSCFSNKFFEAIFNIQFLYIVLIWIFYNFVFCKLKVHRSEVV